MLHAEGLKGLIIFLVVAGVIVPLFHRARIGTVLGFLIAGAALGPRGLGHLAGAHPWLQYVTFEDPQRGAPLAEAGIIILLFLLGLELSLQRLWQLRRYVLGVGVAQVVLTALAIGLGVRVFGGVSAGIVLGSCLALSSTAIVMQLLVEQHRAADLTGRIALSVLLVQDLMVVPILFVVGILAGGALSAGIVVLIRPFAIALAAVVAIMLLGRFVVGPLLRSAVRTGSRDLIMAITLLILVLFSVATGLAGLPVALGAFLAGLLISGSEARHNIEVDLEPFKGLLLGIFFITVGTNVDIPGITADAGWVVAALVALMGIKAAILYGAARVFAVPRAAAAELALLLAQAGEFAFIVIGVAQTGALIPPRLADGAVAVVALSMLVTPLAAAAGRTIAARLVHFDHRGDAPESAAADLDNHVVIGGCGRVGQLIARALESEHVPYMALDTDGERVGRMRRKGLNVFFGDAGRPELLEKVGGHNARAFVVTVNSVRAAERMVAAAHRINPAAQVFARAADAEHAARLLALGAVGVIPETVEASLQLARCLLEGMDLPEEVVTRRLAAVRSTELGELAREEEGA